MMGCLATVFVLLPGKHWDPIYWAFSKYENSFTAKWKYARANLVITNVSGTKCFLRLSLSERNRKKGISRTNRVLL
jgi:hypothetical protein